MKAIKMIVAAVMVMAAVTVMVQDSFAEQRVRLVNRIVLMLDASGSFKNRRMEAVQKASELIDKISNTQSKRFEGKDEVVVISLDAIPETVWSGTKDELKSSSPKDWMKTFEARSDYQYCTDIENGFILATQELHKEPKAAGLYLFAFTDLINEPPAGSATKCQPAKLPSLPSAEFPWDAFSDVETHIMWVPINQKQAWFETVNAAGLGSRFHIHSESESNAVELNAPPKAKHIMTEEEKKEGKARVTEFAKGIGRFVLYGISLLALLFIGGMGMTVLARKNKRTRR